MGAKVRVLDIMSPRMQNFTLVSAALVAVVVIALHMFCRVPLTVENVIIGVNAYIALYAVVFASFGQVFSG